MKIQNDNLVIRSATIEDVPQLCAWWADGKIMAHAGFPNGLKTDQDKLKKSILDKNKKNFRLIIEADKAIGEMSYYLQDDHAEIGIKICDHTYREKGLGSKLVNMLMDYLFETYPISKIILDTNLKNTRAQHVYEKLGFKKVSVNIDVWTNQLGDLESSVDYQLTREDYNESI